MARVQTQPRQPQSTQRMLRSRQGRCVSGSCCPLDAKMGSGIIPDPVNGLSLGVRSRFRSLREKRASPKGRSAGQMSEIAWFRQAVWLIADLVTRTTRTIRPVTDRLAARLSQMPVAKLCIRGNNSTSDRTALALVGGRMPRRFTEEAFDWESAFHPCHQSAFSL
jgi:hypothetical protein